MRVRRLLIALAAVAGLLIWPMAHAGRALIVQRDIGPPDAIIMLASHEWERLPAAAELARRHPDATVLLTYPRHPTPHNCHLCTERVEWLAAEGVPSDRVRVLRGAENTHGEALAALRHAQAASIGRLMIVTSPYHTRRALATFDKVFAGTAIRIGITPAAPAQGIPARWWLNPFDRWYVRYEWTALGFYLIRYGIIP